MWFIISPAPPPNPPTPRAEKWRKRRTCDDVTMRVRDDSCYVPWKGSPCFYFPWSTPALVGSFDLESYVGSEKIDAFVTPASKIVNDHSEIEETSDKSKICNDWSKPVHSQSVMGDQRFKFPPFSELHPPPAPCWFSMQKTFGFLNDTSPIVHRWFGTKMLSSTTNCLVLEVIFIKGCKWTEYIFLTMEYHSLRYFVLQVKWSELPPKEVAWLNHA